VGFSKMNDQLARLAQRILVEMLYIANNIGNANRVEGLAIFKGFGLSLAFVYEEGTGLDASNITPKELMQWTMNLPMPDKAPKRTN
jgi:hypothetical protein